MRHALLTRTFTDKGRGTSKLDKLGLKYTLQLRTTVMIQMLSCYYLIGPFVIDHGLLGRFGAKFVRLPAQIQRLGVARFHLKQKLQAVLCMFDLVKANVAPGCQQVAVFDCCVYRRQIGL